MGYPLALADGILVAVVPSYLSHVPTIWRLPDPMDWAINLHRCTVDVGETTSQHLKHGMVTFQQSTIQKIRTILKRISKPCKQAKYDRLQLVVLVICGYMLPASTFGVWTFNLFITEPQYNLVSWESARRVFRETLQDHPRCKHRRFIVIIVIVTIIINPTMDIFNHEIWPQVQKALTIAHILYDVLYVL